MHIKDFYRKEPRMPSQSPKEEVLSRVVHNAGDYEEVSISCAQGTLAALQEEFNLGDGATLKAATFMPGLASRGGTCGALIAGLMALGMAFGRERLDDPEWAGLQAEKLLRQKMKARRFCERFEAELGSTQCNVLRPKIMGRDYNTWDPKDAQQFIADGGLKKCRLPAETAARIAAELILEE